MEILLSVLYFYPRIIFTFPLLQAFNRPFFRRGIVIQAQLPVFIILVFNRLDTPIKPFRSNIIDGNDDGYLGVKPKSLQMRLDFICVPTFVYPDPFMVISLVQLFSKSFSIENDSAKASARLVLGRLSE